GSPSPTSLPPSNSPGALPATPRSGPPASAALCNAIGTWMRLKPSASASTPSGRTPNTGSSPTAPGTPRPSTASAASRCSPTAPEGPRHDRSQAHRDPRRDPAVPGTPVRTLLPSHGEPENRPEPGGRMTTTATPVDNGVNVEALLGARAAMADNPEIAQFQWR